MHYLIWQHTPLISDINDTQHKWHLVLMTLSLYITEKKWHSVMWNVTIFLLLWWLALLRMIFLCDKCCCVECHYAECHYAECHGLFWHQHLPKVKSKIKTVPNVRFIPTIFCWKVPYLVTQHSSLRTELWQSKNDTHHKWH